MPRCLSACCALSGCSAWQCHISSTDPTHHPNECWLLTRTPFVVASSPKDVWLGISTGTASPYLEPPPRQTQTHSERTASPGTSGAAVPGSAERRQRSLALHELLELLDDVDAHSCRSVWGSVWAGAGDVTAPCRHIVMSHHGRGVRCHGIPPPPFIIHIIVYHARTK